MLMIFIALLLVNIYFFLEYRNKGCNFSECLLANKSFVMRSHNRHTKKWVEKTMNITFRAMPISLFLPCSKSIQTENNVQNFYQNHNDGTQ